ncbi:MAG: DUF4350 domain-containing protein [Asgard group archaeon]|nr:DUF4350 domain-containing protein [Asgard group archaeon]
MIKKDNFYTTFRYMKISKRIFTFFIIFSLLLNAASLVNATTKPQPEYNLVPEAKYPQTREIRVAIYDEDNLTAPAYSSSPGFLRNNVTYLASLFSGSDSISTTLVTEEDILDNVLTTVNYDVLMLADNLPRESITSHVEEFWLAGGGILAFDGSAGFLNYFGILPPESLGDDGSGTYWNYDSDGFDLNVRHPITKAYSTVTTINAAGGFLGWDWTALSGSAIASRLTPVALDPVDSNVVSILAFDPIDRGGKIVTIAHDLVFQSVPELEQIIRDTPDWLAPRPKAKIAFDLSHHPRLGVDDWDTLSQFAGKYYEARDYLVSHGYTVDKIYPVASGDNITADRLEPFDMLICTSPDFNYSSSERTTIQNWVNDGGSLLIAGEEPIMTFMAPTQNLNQLMGPFGMSLTNGAFTTTTFTDFNIHPTTEGCTGLYLNAYGYLNITGTTEAIWTYGPAENVAVAAKEYGNGRVICTADINWFQDSYIINDDNYQYILNIANWLSSATAEVLIYVDDVWAPSFYKGALPLALNDLGVNYYLTSGYDFVDEHAYFNYSLNLYSWDMVVIDCPNHFGLEYYLDEIEDYVDGGGRLIMSWFDADLNATHPLWEKLGMEYSGDYTTGPPLYIWDTTHDIFTTPHDFGGITYIDPVSSAGDEGDKFTVLSGATALAGYTVAETAGEGIIVLSDNKKTLYNGYLIDLFTGDADDSTYMDSFELWKNELVLMLNAGSFFDLLPDWAWYAIGGGLGLIILIIIIVAIASRAKKKRQS